MNDQETVMEANRQIRLLMVDCSDTEREQLGKHIRPLPVPPKRRYGKPERLGQILSRVMDNISKGCQKGVIL